MVKMAIWCDKRECFAWSQRAHGCGVLNDTNFIGRECPFFKTREAAEKESTLAMLKNAARMEAEEDEIEET